MARDLSSASSVLLARRRTWIPFGGIRSASAYTVTNLTSDRSFDADTVAIAELADVVGTLIADLKASGILL
ncbi:MAG TPA: hypothetical protein VF201_15000 [Nitrolancea sp.]